ncbi:hypothetical protein HMN09_00974400 [Mycena chlorophos]|uniref:Uncharacterized protein n=1 Tax=Mycena chlorophos TaxID=658473 RepID=A0A8H6SHY1_MYCCL|nr:hypothetical protein HMN09_00974400 [Mycena chlorophos]
MDQLPPELIEVIGEHIRDKPTLKCCSLAASVFRGPCQKRLFQLLKILILRDYNTGSHWISEEPATRLESAPHLARYVRQLRIQFSPMGPWRRARVTWMRVLARILAQLTATQEVCLVAFGDWDQRDRHGDPIQVLLAWLTRQPPGSIRRVIVEGPENVPMRDFQILLSVASSAYFRSLRVEAGPVATTDDRLAENSLHVLNTPLSPTVVDLLLDPQLGYYTKSLRTLSIHLTPSNLLSSLVALCCATANHLESIQFNEWIPDVNLSAIVHLDVQPQLSLPKYLPNLAHLSVRVDKELHGQTFKPAWLLQSVIVNLLPSSVSPALRLIDIHVTMSIDGHQLQEFLGQPLGSFMETLDDALVENNTIKAVHWIFCNTSFTGWRPAQFLAVLDAFSRAVESALPKTWSKGLLFFSREEFEVDPLLR